MKVEWVLHIKLSVSRVAEIQPCFETEVNFLYPSSVDDLDQLILLFKNSLREDNDFTTLSNNANKIVMDDVSGLANISNNFARKFGYN